MRFLIDNALSPIIAQGLVEAGYDAIHVRDIGLASASDLEIFELAIRQNRILVSADTDFGALLVFRETTKPSFILFRQTDKRPSSQIVFLLNQLPTLKDDLLTGCVVVFEDSRIRVRPLPITKS
ncbi:MAG: hypothetical protein D6743_08375 [Calditrichaeota bacterium]|nr:MAG: hypothetical protein D6743_08375 [Calditrichota bacterium]